MSKKRKEEVTKKHQYEIRNCWPPVLSGGISPCFIIETPHKELQTSDFSRFTNYRFKNLFINPLPLPDLSWGCSKEVWLNMLKKETRYVHDKHFEALHSDLEPQMRSILLDWLLEVCSCSNNTNFLCLYMMENYLDINVLLCTLSLPSPLGYLTIIEDTKMENVYYVRVKS